MSWAQDDRGTALVLTLVLAPLLLVALAEWIPGESRRGPQEKQRERCGGALALHRGELTATTWSIVTGRRTRAPKIGVRTGTSAAMRTVGRSYRAPVRAS